MTRGKDGRPIIRFESPAQWAAWLQRYGTTSEGIWIRFAKKGSGVASVTYQEALDVALCYGWIDSLVNRLDERFYLQRFTPRGPRSKWSKINCGKVAKLIETGAMRPAGQKQVDAAKRDGRWRAAYASPRNIKEHPDFKSALARNPKAARCWAGLKRTQRYRFLYHIQDAKRPETRQKRIAQFITILKTRATIR